ncbi:uncharacterized protein LOC114518504 isoform X2 [Dendronephthya gigantea]|uniref:uncharacterized protein LOC114518504 isoform X2 n=1 Tax=Dendronephthya gigantea TaxID=151771 RepID=UPI001068DD84|nr:uncharacterized protein LOC114518504 isoform X2 [Dendronephthya gigantea]
MKKTGCLLLVLCLALFTTAKLHHKKIGHKHRHKVKRQTNSYENYLASTPQDSSVSGQYDQNNSPAAAGTDESQPAWCQDDIQCANFHKSDCKTDPWVMINCARKCNLCMKNADESTSKNAGSASQTTDTQQKTTSEYAAQADGGASQTKQSNVEPTAQSASTTQSASTAKSSSPVQSASTAAQTTSTADQSDAVSSQSNAGPKQTTTPSSQLDAEKTQSSAQSSQSNAYETQASSSANQQDSANNPNPSQPYADQRQTTAKPEQTSTPSTNPTLNKDSTASQQPSAASTTSTQTQATNPDSSTFSDELQAAKEPSAESTSTTPANVPANPSSSTNNPASQNTAQNDQSAYSQGDSKQTTASPSGSSTTTTTTQTDAAPANAYSADSSKQTTENPSATTTSTQIGAAQADQTKTKSGSSTTTQTDAIPANAYSADSSKQTTENPSATTTSTQTVAAQADQTKTKTDSSQQTTASSSQSESPATTTPASQVNTAETSMQGEATNIKESKYASYSQTSPENPASTDTSLYNTQSDRRTSENKPTDNPQTTTAASSGKSSDTNDSPYFTSSNDQTQNSDTTPKPDSQTTTDNKLRYSYTMQIEDLPESQQDNDNKDKAKQGEKPLLNEEDINITLPNAKKSKDKESDWCKDEEKCSTTNETDCTKDWMQLNCPKRCGICGGASEKSSSEPDQNGASIVEPKEAKHKGSLEDIRITLPSTMVAGEDCKDHVECIEYPVSSCNNGWMKQNCRRKCALCGAKTKKLPQTKTEEYTLGNTGESEVCYYDGIPHEHGSKWSPGPCTPECACQNGNVRCTVIQCPKLTCSKQTKKRWSCCPECTNGEPKPITTKIVHYVTKKPKKHPHKHRKKHYYSKTHGKNKKHEKAFFKIGQDTQNAYQEDSHVVSMPFANASKSQEEIEAEEEEILRKYGNQESEEENDEEPEALDGGYAEWSSWSKCLTPCGGGVQERFRKCDRPPPAFGGLDCRHIGPALESRECNNIPCPVHGGFSSWSPWVECSTSCGGGVTTRSRLCDNPSPRYGGNDCSEGKQGASVESKTCNSFQCEGADLFTQWSEWTECNKECGGGVSFRKRTCTSPLPGGNGQDCSLRGSVSQTKACNMEPCSVNGGYTQWTEWSTCSRSCGPGITSRHRTCTQPVPSADGKDCSVIGESFQQKVCYLNNCKASGRWTNWTNWNKCTLPCGGGIQTRTRKCIEKPCEGNAHQSQLCNAYHCPINGHFTDWSAWSACSKSCGDGQSTRTRKCENPSPKFGGKTCTAQGLGPSKEKQKCNVKDCQISRDGGYSQWSAWTECSMTCGTGAMSRYRACDNPRQAGAGKDCTRLGVGAQSVPCFLKECPINGNYSEWSGWSACSASCGDGSRSRTRSCTNPEPMTGGKSCAEIGDDIESETCYQGPCPVTAKLGEWSAWESCSKTCGYGIRQRKRRCLGSNEFGESYCNDDGLGLSQQAERCFERSCPVDGNFGPWSAWSVCTATCGGGAMSRFRNCSDPIPMHGGKGCERIGAAFEIKSCSDSYCPVDGGYSMWSEFGPCSRTCGTGYQTRKRTCTSPSPEHGGRDCNQFGSTQDVQECATDPCPISGNFSAWSEWANCSKPCGNGVMVRSRSCNNPTPSFAGQDCTSLGPQIEQKNCIRESCPERCSCGGWTSWSECTQSCGGGFQTRKRQCTPPKSGVESCSNEEQETQLCNLNVCPVDGGYSKWSEWTNCIGDCEHGYKSRSRECNNPTPAFGGRPCQEAGLGESYESTSCLKNPCAVNGKYSSWSPWSACSSTCGLGQKKRTRTCNNPSPAFGGLDCSRYGAYEQAMDCFVADCPVNGGFSPWSEWSECSKSCGWGYQSRERECNAPEPSRGGKDCTAFGDSNELQACMIVDCPVDGKFTEWGAWGECSKTCGEGRKRRKRFCTAPKPDFGGKTCAEQKLGDTAEMASCDLGPCPDAGGWGDWSAWSYCSATCGRGKMERSRQCDAPEPVGGGRPCVGLLTQQKDCTLRDCPVNGNYTNWGKWTDCDAKCGDGFKTRWRSCSNPVATGGGQDCAEYGPDSESKVCFKKPCKVDGSWGQWSQWSMCSKTCGDGAQVRSRVCDDPKPAAGGTTCAGTATQEKYCRMRDCCDIPYVDLGCFVDTGNPSTMPEMLLTDTDQRSPLFSGVSMKRGIKDWDDYMSNLICRCAQITNEKGYTHFGIQNLGECRSGVNVDRSYASQGARVAYTHQGPRPWVGCMGRGMKQCKRPSLSCVGQDQTNYVYGLKNIAPVNGNYTSWSLWSPCSKSCDRGLTSRRRSCTNPPPLYDGKDCEDIGQDEEMEECFLKPCAVNGAWSGWAIWSDCSASCGTGRRTRIRGCNSPAPSNGGDLCNGPDTEIAECFKRDCPSDGRWSDWQAWEPCSVSCGFGVQLRTRYCNNPAPVNGGKMCEGDLVESSPCEAKPCPINGGFADWSNWSVCSRSCGRGSKSRVRKCINPLPRYGGQSCERLGPGEEKIHCNANPCPVHGNWGAWNGWSRCSAECGPGVRTRDRRCNNPYPNYGGASCVGKGHESTVCSMPDCAIDGNWGAWSEWSDCQSDCGVATRHRTRACIDPPPAHGGRGCEGDAEEYSDCKLGHCPIDGMYSDWSMWSGCDRPCGSGHKTRARSCSNPEPQFGGMNCTGQGSELETVACNTDPCKVDGGWSGWTSWSSCSRTCGLGLTTRSRSCSYPVAEFGGKPCPGKSEEKKPCKDFDCCDVPYKDVGCFIDTQRTPRPLPELLFSERDKISWKKWKSFMSDLICRCAQEARYKQYTHFGVQHYGECYSGPQSWKTYRDEGLRQDFTRPPDPQPWVGCVDESLNQCKQPNLECVGKQNTNFVYTIDQVKPVNGNYSDWTAWSRCSTSCGPGSRYRTRSCTNPAPSFGGQPCYNMGGDEEVEACFLNDCPVDGGWNNWGEWTECSAKCGTGDISRSRQCDSPAPQYGGKKCPGKATESVPCNFHKCPVRGGWAVWSAWSKCSSSCGNGQQTRKRECNSPKAEYGGEPCTGTSVVFQNCVEKECPGIWGDWSDWSECSRTCGSGGTHSRTRTCQGGRLCDGPRHETEQCMLQDCPECSKSADIAFIMDSSAATDESTWNRLKSFARGVANAFLLNDDATRVGLITYSARPTLELKFDEKNDRDEFSDFLNTVTPTHGTPNLEEALMMANDKLFVPSAGMRAKVPNVAIILAEEGPMNSYNDSSIPLKERGITLMSVGVGNRVNQYELQRIATSPDHAILVNTLDDAIASVSNVANATCLAKPTPPPVKWGPWSDWSSCSRLCDAGVRHRLRSCMNGDECVGKSREESGCMLQKCPQCKSVLDVVFAIPISESVPKTELDEAKKFVRGVIDGLSISPQGTHVGLLGYFDYPRVELKLDTFYDKEDILRALSSVQTVDGFNNTRIDSALKAAQSDMFAPANGVRAYIPKVLVFLASGDSSDQNLKDAAMPLKNVGTTIIPLVTGDLETKTIAPIGSSTLHYFASDNFGNLASKLDAISAKLCGATLATGSSINRFGATSRVHGISQLLLKSGDKKPAVSPPAKPQVSQTKTPTVVRPQTVVTSNAPPKVAPQGNAQKPEVKPAIQPVVNLNEKLAPGAGLWKDWGVWSACSKSCGTGKSTRVRLCDSAKCNGQRPTQALPCKLQDCIACNHNLDLVLAVDSSDAVPKKGWKKIKSFMTGILDAFRISESDTHVGIVTFSSVPYLETRFSEKRNDITELVKNMQQLQGKQRRVDKVLRMANAEFFSPESRGFRPDKSKAFVVITGGNPTQGTENLISAVRPLTQNGVSVVAVGIGSDADEGQLRSMGGRKENSLKVPNYDDLQSYVTAVVKDICEAGHKKPPPLPAPAPKKAVSKVAPPPPQASNAPNKKLSLPEKKIESLINKWGTWSNWAACTKTCGEGTRARSRDCAGYNCTGPSLDKEACFVQDCPDCQKRIDLVFAMDGSDDVIDKEFMQEKTFVTNVLNAFSVLKDQTHVGVATYGADVSQDIPLTNQFDKDSLFVAVNSLIKNKGKGKLTKVLETARSKLFTGSRDNVAKVLVLLTSMKNKMAENPEKAAQALKKSGIEVVVVGAGSNDRSARDVLGKVASSNSRAFPLMSFNDLINDVYLVATSACQAKPVPLTGEPTQESPAKPSVCSKPLDVAFALDSSEDVSSFQWQRQKDFVSQVIDGLQIAPDGVHTGIVAYGAMPTVDLKLNVRNKDKQALLQSVAGLRRAVGKRNIGSLLDMSKYKVFGPDSGRRSDTPSTLVVLQLGADRPGADTASVKRSSEGLQKDGVRVYVVGVGSSVSRNDLVAFASSNNDVLHLPSLSDKRLAGRLIDTLCEGPKQTPESDQPSLGQAAPKSQGIRPGTSDLQNVLLTSSPSKPAVPAQNPSTPEKKKEKDFTKVVDIVAASCREIKRRVRGAEDGEFPIMFSPHCAPVKLYCHGMDTEDPKEYLTLPAGSDNNYASFHKERLKNFRNCDGSTDPSPSLTAKYWGNTKFSKIRINPKNGLVKQDDFRFAISEGNPVKFGRGGDCFSLGECRRGGFQMDLSGTGLELRDDVMWKSWGAPKGSRMINFTRSPDHTKVSAICGGSCGGCQPARGRIYLIPSSCNTPLGKKFKRSIIEATELLDEPFEPLHKKRGKVAKKKIKHNSKALKDISKKHFLLEKHRRNRKHSKKH